MANITTDMLGKVISFDLYPAAILGSTFSRVKLLGILDPATAIGLADIATMHANVYPTIPVPNRPEDNYASYNYLKVKQLSSGNIEIIGIPWIDGEVTINENMIITAVVNDVSGSDYEKITKMFLAAGYNAVKLTIAPPAP